MRFLGVLESWNDERGFGCIAPSDGGLDVFVHIKAFRLGAARPVVGEHVTFGLRWDDNGSCRACLVENVERPEVAKPRRMEAPARCAQPRWLVLPTFSALAMYVQGHVGVAWWAPIGYGVLSLFAFAMYASDETAAVAGRWRTSEANLHLVSLLGG